MSGSVPFNMTRDINGYNGFGLVPSGDIYNVTLTSGTASSITLPSNKEHWLVAFSMQPGSNVWIAYGTTAEVPAGNTWASATSELNPNARYLKAGTMVSAVTPDTSANVSMALYYLSGHVN